MTDDTPRSRADLRHDALLAIAQGLARVTYPMGKPDGSSYANGEKRVVPSNETGQQWWNRVLDHAHVEVFGPDSEDLRFRELLNVWEHCCDKQLERLVAWRDKVEEWYPERKEDESVQMV